MFFLIINLTNTQQMIILLKLFWAADFACLILPGNSKN